MASSAGDQQQYAGIIPDYGGDDDDDDPRGVPAAAPSRGAFTFPSLRAADEELAMEFLSTIFVYFSVFGLAFLVVGVIAIILPVVFVTIAVPQMVAWILVIGGLVSFLHFCFIFGAPGTTSFLFLSILHAAVGLWLLIQASTRVGMTFLWIMLGWFLVHGMVKFVMGYETRSINAWPAIVVSGAVAIALGILSIALTPTYGLFVLGILFGVDLAITALAILLVSMVAYQVASHLSSASIEPLLEQC